MNDASMVDKMVLAVVVILAAIAIIMIVKRVYTVLTTPVDASAAVSSAPMNDAHGFSARGLTGHVNAHDVMNTAVARRNTNVR
jgi:predicted thioredoxin/glutaredoxin